MEIDFNTVTREGERLIKYPLNAIGTKHLFCYKLNGYYYEYIMHLGQLIDRNNKPLKTTILTGNKRKGKHFNEYQNSSLNLIF